MNGSNNPLFTVIIFAWRPQFLPRSMSAVLNQTYKNLQIILVDNFPAQDNPEIGKEVTKMVNDFEKADSRVQPLRYPRIPFSLKTPLANYDLGCRKALELAKGDYFIIQNDDDYMATDYIEKMVALFLENPECTSAAGLPIAQNAKGEITDEPRVHNFRPRHMPGHLMVIDYNRKGKMFSAPGCSIFAYKRTDYLARGGHQEEADLGQLHSIIAFGVTGFDETAKFNWVRHDAQLNLLLATTGNMMIDRAFLYLKNSKFLERWKVFGEPVAKEMHDAIVNRAFVSSTTWFAINLYKGRFQACLKILQYVCFRPAFWFMLPRYLWLQFPLNKNSRQFLEILYNKLHLREPLRLIFKIWPSLERRSPWFSRLSKKVNKTEGMKI